MWCVLHTHHKGIHQPSHQYQHQLQNINQKRCFERLIVGVLVQFSCSGPCQRSMQVQRWLLEEALLVG